MRKLLAFIFAVALLVNTKTLLLAVVGGGSFPIPDVPGSGSVVNLTATPQGGWVWFVDPRAVQYAGYLYVGYIEGDGDVRISVLDDSDGSLVSTVTLHAGLEVDDHDDPSLYIRPSDHKLVVFYSKHLGPYIIERTSITSLDTDPDLSDGFTSENNLTLDESAPDLFFTYPNPVLTTTADGVTADVLWLFYRDHVGGTAGEWHYEASGDGGATFTGRTPLHSITYSRVVSDGAGTIHMAASEYPTDSDATKIYHLYRQSAAWHQSDGTTMGGGVPFDGSDMTTVYDSGGDKVWVWDIAVDGTGKPVITFVRFVSTSDHRYYYARWTGSAWDVHEITAAGGTIVDDLSFNPDQVYYSGGVVLDHADPTIVYLSKDVSGQFEMFKYVTADGGTTWTPTQLTTASTEKQLRPAPVRDAGNIPVVWLNGHYGSYLDYSQGISAYIP